MVLGSKGQRSRSQGHKVQKHIEGDRVAGVSFHLCRVPVLYSPISNLFDLESSLRIVFHTEISYVDLYSALGLEDKDKGLWSEDKDKDL